MTDRLLERRRDDNLREVDIRHLKELATQLDERLRTIWEHRIPSVDPDVFDWPAPQIGRFNSSYGTIKDEGAQVFNSLVEEITEKLKEDHGHDRRFIEKQFDQALTKLAEVDEKGQIGKANFETVARQCAAELLTPDGLVNVYTLVVNLVLEEPVKIGQVTFHPHDEGLRRVEGFLRKVLTPNPHHTDEEKARLIRFSLDRIRGGNARHCIASVKVLAHLESAKYKGPPDAERALHLIRLIKSAFPSYQDINIGIVGQIADKTTGSLAVLDDSTRMQTSGIADRPFRFADQIREIAKDYFDFDQLCRWYVRGAPTSLDRSLYTGLKWIGQADGDLDDLAACAKYIVATEAMALNRQGVGRRDTAAFLKRYLPIVCRDDREGRKEVVALIQDIWGTGERDSVMHDGTTRGIRPDHLRESCLQIARTTFWGIYRRAQAEDLNSLDQLVRWALNHAT